MKIKDVMTKEVISVNTNIKIKEVAKILIKKRIHGVPVVDSDNRVVGIITETDFFSKNEDSLYIPSFIDFMQKSKISQSVSFSKKNEIKKILNATANDIMTKNCITISPEADIRDLLKLFSAKRLHTVPVIKNDNSLCGIITLADIIALIEI